MPDIEAARRTCDETVSALSRAESARIPVDRVVHVRSGLAALARCRALLIGIVALDRVDRADIVGVLLRAMLEAWYLGVITLLGDEHDLEKLQADNRYWKNRFAESRDGISPESGPEKTFSVWDRAKRASELMTIVGEDPNGPLEWYRDLYAGESLTNAHASASSMSPYLLEDPSGTIGIHHDPEPAEDLRYGRLLLAAALAVTLGRWTYERSAIDTSELNAITLP
jgi:hypothetical protein